VWKLSYATKNGFLPYFGEKSGLEIAVEKVVQHTVLVAG
jgi:hypothetical protein